MLAIRLVKSAVDGMPTAGPSLNSEMVDPAPSKTLSLGFIGSLSTARPPAPRLEGRCRSPPFGGGFSVYFPYLWRTAAES